MSGRRALRTIKALNLKWSKKQCLAYVDKYINVIAKKYPDGIPSNEYFVVPGFEHTVHKPIIKYNEVESTYELDSTSIFDFIKPQKEE